MKSSCQVTSKNIPQFSSFVSSSSFSFSSLWSKKNDDLKKENEITEDYFLMCVWKFKADKTLCKIKHFIIIIIIIASCGGDGLLKTLFLIALNSGKHSLAMKILYVVVKKFCQVILPG